MKQKVRNLNKILSKSKNPELLLYKVVNNPKFKAFLKHAMDSDADLIAMGHYARKGWIDGKPALLRAVGQNKDQTYFLSQLTEEKIKKAIEESIQEGDEVTLPGMGVFFEIIWQESTDDERNKILTTLKNRFKKKAN